MIMTISAVLRFSHQELWWILSTWMWYHADWFITTS